MYILNIKDLDINKLYFTSDLHMNHFNIARYCHRPFESRQEMNEALINNWNSVVPEDGIVINCGDLTLVHKESLKEYQRIAQKLNGQQLLIRGNHDRVPLNIEENDKFIAIVDLATVIVKDTKLIASHFPLMAYPADYNVFGHIHTRSNGLCEGLDADVNDKLRWNQYDVGVDQNNYTPISFTQLMEIFNKRHNG